MDEWFGQIVGIPAYEIPKSCNPQYLWDVLHPIALQQDGSQHRQWILVLDRDAMWASKMTKYLDGELFQCLHSVKG